MQMILKYRSSLSCFLWIHWKIFHVKILKIPSFINILFIYFLIHDNPLQWKLTMTFFIKFLTWRITKKFPSTSILLKSCCVISKLLNCRQKTFSVKMTKFYTRAKSIRISIVSTTQNKRKLLRRSGKVFPIHVSCFCWEKYFRLVLVFAQYFADVL